VDYSSKCSRPDAHEIGRLAPAGRPNVRLDEGSGPLPRLPDPPGAGCSKRLGSTLGRNQVLRSSLCADSDASVDWNAIGLATGAGRSLASFSSRWGYKLKLKFCAVYGECAGEGLFFHNDVQVDWIVKRIGNGGPHDCVFYKRFQDFKRHISLDAHAHRDSVKTKRLGREIACAPQRGNSDLAGDFDLEVADRNGTRHCVRVNSNRETRTKGGEKSFAGGRGGLVGQRRCVVNFRIQRRKFTDVGPVTKPSCGNSAAAEIADRVSSLGRRIRNFSLGFPIN
jgi:hypothetical protein